MANIQNITISQLVDHPDNPNHMSDSTFARLVRNIQRTGRYEPLVVRPCPGREGFYQIINGHHRCRALRRLGYTAADAVVWDIDDQQTEILLATLNRLGGSDVLQKKIALLKKLRERTGPGELAKLLPQTARQIERLTSLRLPTIASEPSHNPLASALVFFVSDQQRATIERALLLASSTVHNGPKAVRRAAALAAISERFIRRRKAWLHTAPKTSNS